MKPYLRIEENPSESISFLIGNTLREILFQPWKIVFLPLTLYRRIRHQREEKHLVLESNIDILYLIDAETLLNREVREFGQILSSRGNDLIASIGEFDSTVDYSIPSRKSNSDTKYQWNKDLEKILASIIASRRPKILIFIGKYPYAGLLSVLRRLESQVFTAWLPIRSQPKTIKERASRFGNILQWKFKVEPAIELDLNNIHIDSKVSSELILKVSQWAKECHLNHSNPHDAGLHFYSESGLGRVKSSLERGHLVAYLYDSDLDAEFTSSRNAPFFFPISVKNEEEMKYGIKQILSLYSTKQINLRTSSNKLCEKWIGVLEDTFNRRDS
jgi:hypothetical protein